MEGTCEQMGTTREFARMVVKAIDKFVKTKTIHRPASRIQAGGTPVGMLTPNVVHDATKIKQFL